MDHNLERLRSLNPHTRKEGFVERYNPLDILFTQNPEVASIAYANRANVLTPDILPSMEHFRTCQMNEKVKIAQEITNRLGIDAHEREVRAWIEGNVETTQLTQGGLTERQRIAANSQNHQSDNQLKAVTAASEMTRDVQKLKYATAAKIYNDHVDGMKYLSDNEVKAKKLEAEAIRDAVMFTEEMRRGAIEQVSADRLEKATRVAMIRSNQKLQEAEIARDGKIQLAYIQQETERNWAMMNLETERARSLGLIGVACYDAIGRGFQSAAQLLMQSGKSHYHASMRSEFGNIELDVKIDDE